MRKGKRRVAAEVEPPLFANAGVVVPEKHAGGPQADVMAAYLPRWRGRYGKDFHPRPVDWVKAAALVTGCGGSVAEAVETLDRWFADDDAFNHGHSLAALTSATNLPKFRAAPPLAHASENGRGRRPAHLSIETMTGPTVRE